MNHAHQMRKVTSFMVTVVVFALVYSPSCYLQTETRIAHQELPAFPGAEGFHLVPTLRVGTKKEREA